MKDPKRSRCPKCFWGLYDGTFCQNNKCDINEVKSPFYLTQREALLMIYARGVEHPLNDGYCSEEWYSKMTKQLQK